MNSENKKSYTIDEALSADPKLVKVISDQGTRHTYIPAAIFKLPNVTRLHIAMSNLTSIPDEISELQNLSEVFLEHNNISRITPELHRLLKLKKLRLYGNKIKDMNAICEVKSLQDINIGRNLITEIPDSISNLQKLRYLDCGNLFYSNNIQYISEAIGQLTKLERLSFHGGTLATLPKALGELTSLKKLSAVKSSVTSFNFDFGMLGNLEVLALNGNNIGYLPENLGKAINLKELYLSGNPINTVPDSFFNLKQLKVLSIANTNIPDELVARIRNENPKLSIIRNLSTM